MKREVVLEALKIMRNSYENRVSRGAAYPLSEGYFDLPESQLEVLDSLQTPVECIWIDYGDERGEELKGVWDKILRLFLKNKDTEENLYKIIFNNKEDTGYSLNVPLLRDLLNEAETFQSPNLEEKFKQLIEQGLIEAFTIISRNQEIYVFSMLDNTLAEVVGYNIREWLFKTLYMIPFIK